MPFLNMIKNKDETLGSGLSLNKSPEKTNNFLNNKNKLSSVFKNNKNSSLRKEENNFNLFYKSFASSMKSVIVKPNFKFNNKTEELLCLNLIKSEGDLVEFIRLNYKITLKDKDDNDKEKTEILKKAQNDIKTKISIFKTEINKFPIT